MKNKIKKAKRSFWSAAFFIGALTTIIIDFLIMESIGYLPF